MVRDDADQSAKGPYRSRSFIEANAVTRSHVHIRILWLRISELREAPESNPCVSDTLTARLTSCRDVVHC